MKRTQVAETTDGIKDWNERCGVDAWQLSSRSVTNPENASPDEMYSGDGGDELLAEIGVLRAKCVDERLWSIRLQAFWKAWSGWKNDRGYTDFTDMVVRALEEVDSLDADIVMIDEAQDMSLLEMRLARKWGDNAEQLLVVGDPDQTIYEWRGADPSAFYEGEASVSQVLSQSYRVPRAVHKMALTWIDQITNRNKVEYKPRDEDGAVVKHLGLCWKEQALLATLCERLVEDGSSVAVLASCGYMLNPLIAELKKRAIPFGNPYRSNKWNPLSGKGARQLLSFLQDERCWTWEELWDFVDPLVANGVLVRGTKERLKEKIASRRRFDTVEDRIIDGLYTTTLAFFEEQHRRSVYHRDLAWWREHLRASEASRLGFLCDIAKSRGKSALHEKPRLSVGTIHSYKGGQADKVVLIPDLSRAAAGVYYSREKDSVIRLFYVGMTRSRKELHILGPSGFDFCDMSVG